MRIEFKYDGYNPLHHESTLYIVEEDGSLKQVAKVTALEFGAARRERKQQNYQRKYPRIEI